MFAQLWCGVNIVCVLAALTQLFFILMVFVNPNQLNTDTSEIALQDIDFPLDIKICAEPAFDENAIVEAGYGTEWNQYDYFTGRSRFNRSIFGCSLFFCFSVAFLIGIFQGSVILGCSRPSLQKHRFFMLCVIF